MKIDSKLETEIKGDVKGLYEIQIERKAIESIQKLQDKGKMSHEEVKKLYATNFKKLLTIDVKTSDILTNVSSQIDGVTNKLLAVHLNKQNEGAKEAPYKIKQLIYRTLGIKVDLTKNSTTGNLVKGVVDELLSIPEMIVEICKHPIDFAKGLKTALIDNFSQTMHAIKTQFTDIAGGLGTPESAYKTGRSAVLIILTVFPGGLGKSLLKIGKSVIKTPLMVIFPTGRGVIKESIKTTIKNTKNTIKKGVENTKNSIKDSKIGVKYQNTKAKNIVNTTTKDLQKIGDDIVSKQKELQTAQSHLKIKNLSKDRINYLRKQIHELNTEINTLLETQLKLNKQLKSAKKEVSKTNTKLGIDNMKIGRIKSLETKANKIGDDIVSKQKELQTAQNRLNNKNLTKDAKDVINKSIAQLEKQIDKLSKTKESLLKKANGMDVRISKSAKESLRIRLIEKMQKTKGFSIDKLRELRTSPHRLSLAKDLLGLRQLNGKLKGLKKSNEDALAILNRKGKNGKTSLENAKKHHQFPRAKKVLEQEKITKGLPFRIDAINVDKIKIKQRVYNQLTGLGVLGGINISDLKDEFFYDLTEYLNLDNSQCTENKIESICYESGSVDCDDFDISGLGLDKMSDAELKSAKITITGLASKTGSNDVNTRIATERANNAKNKMLLQFPGLNPQNIMTDILLQPIDSQENINDRQGVKIDVESDNLTYVAGYDEIRK